MPGVALVTGGAVRIGRAISLGLAAEGYDLAINYRSSGKEARELSVGIRKRGRKALLCPGDVSRAADVRRISGQVRDAFGRLDLLVNNASTFLATPLLEVSGEEWDRVMAVNVKGPFLLVRESAHLLRAARGNVVNLADLSAVQPWARYPHHSVSKAALVQLTKVMARALAPAIRVNAIAPGSVLLPESYTEEERERSRTQAALGALGTPEDVVRTVLFLAGSPFITGEVIFVDGGRLLNS